MQVAFRDPPAVHVRIYMRMSECVRESACTQDTPRLYIYLSTRHVCRYICPTPWLVQAVNRTTRCRNPKFGRIASQSTKKEGLNPGSCIRKIAHGKSIDSSGQWSSSGGRAVASGGRASRAPSAVPKSLGHLFPTVSRPRNSRCTNLRLLAKRLQARSKHHKTLTKQRFPKNQQIDALAQRASIR